MDGWIHHYWPSACLKTTGRDRRHVAGVGAGVLQCIYTTLWGTTRLKSPVNANGSGAETTCMLTAHSRLGTPRAPRRRVSLAQNSSCVCWGISAWERNAERAAEQTEK
jgi:hypothetical protein